MTTSFSAAFFDLTTLATAVPVLFMKVSRVRILISESFPDTNSVAIRPVLCRVCEYSSPGLPKPTTIYILLLWQIKLDNTILANYDCKVLERISEAGFFLSFDSSAVPSLHSPTLHRGRRVNG